MDVNVSGCAMDANQSENDEEWMSIRHNSMIHSRCSEYLRLGVVAETTVVLTKHVCLSDYFLDDRVLELLAGRNCAAG